MPSRTLAALAVAAAVAATGCGSRPAPAAQARSLVPWVDRPGTFFTARPLPVHWRPANARPCIGAQLRIFARGGNGATGHSFAYFALRNVSRRTCILRGFPSVVASEPGKPDVAATDGLYIGGNGRAGNMPPGGITMLTLETDRDCPARYATPGTFPTRIYHMVTIGIPGGGRVILHESFDVECGLRTGRFTVAEPPQRYTQSPAAHLRASLELPSHVVAGTTLDYVVDLTNPTAVAAVLSPCPGYFQDLSAAGKAILSLNCRALARIPPHQTVRFAMRLAVPAAAPTGPGTVYWQIAAALGPSARGTLHVRGHDTPCTASQLSVRIVGPGRVPGFPNVFGAKGIATDVPLTVTNTSGRPCSVYGTPIVRIRAADAHDLGLHQVINWPYAGRPPAPQAVVILAPHGGTAHTTLYWYLSWCGPNPEPVTVTITFPANGAAVMVRPLGGWTPPPCPGGKLNPRDPGLVSADPFH